MHKQYKAILATKSRRNSFATAILMTLLFIFMLHEGLSEISNGNLMGCVFIIFGIAAFYQIPILPWFAPKRYIISINCIYIEWIIKGLKIPFNNISKAEVMDGRFVFKRAISVTGSRGLFGTFGLYLGEKLPAFESYVSDERRVIVLYRKQGMPVVISPDDIEDFIDTLKNHSEIECVTDEAAEEELVSVYIPFSKSEKIIEYISAVFIIFITGSILYFSNKLPLLIPTHYDQMGNPDSWMNRLWCFSIPITAVLMCLFISAREYFLSRRKVFKSSVIEASVTSNPIRSRLGIIKLCILSLTSYFTLKLCLFGYKEKDLEITILILVASILSLSPLISTITASKMYKRCR